MRLCSVDGCKNKHMAIGYCNTHYRRHRRGNQIDKKSCYDLEIKERLKSFVFIEDGKTYHEDSCWIWSGAKNRKGYGQISHNNKRAIAHRLSYQVHVGEIPVGMIICHKCDRPECINPDHLFLGTVKDNTQDMLSKKRNKPMSGSSNGNSKLSTEDVIKIKLLLKENKNCAEIGRMFNVSDVSISGIKNNKTWRHVNV